MRIAIVTTAAPPSPNGQARVLGQIIGTDFTRAVFLTDQMRILEGDANRTWQHVALSPYCGGRNAEGKNGIFRLLRHGYALLRTVLIRANEITAALRRDPVDILVGCSGNPFDLPAAFLAARQLQLPFVAYLFDDPVYQWPLGIYRHIAKISERLWSRGAAAIIVPNENLATDIRKRIARPIHIVRNPVDPIALAMAEGEKAASTPNQSVWRLLYSGSVYAAQSDAFRTLVTALSLLNGRVVLEVYTAQSASDLVAADLRSPHVFVHPSVAHGEAIQLQRNADVLFLPLAFNSNIPEVIRSSAPAKLGEYLASGRPILVHAPADAFVSELINRADAGLVVDTPDPRRLAQALVAITDDEALRTRIISNAGRLAKEFDVDTARATFLIVLQDIKQKHATAAAT